MKKATVLFISVVLIFSCISCGSKPAEKTKTQPKATQAANVNDLEKRKVCAQIHSKALEGNVANESADRDVNIYLPPSYFKSENKYPVFYFLHGFGEDPVGYVDPFVTSMENAAKENKQEFIVVFVDGKTEQGGSFFVNSPITGNWEDYVVNDVVGYVDQNYRTLANKDSRGICGFSMGGSGALSLGMNHPDVFGAVYAKSPGLIADGDMKMAYDSWATDESFLGAYGRAFSPNKKAKDLGNIPNYKGSAKDKKIIADWQNGFGNLDNKVKNYLSKGTQLKAIKLEYGKSDNYAWIPRGCVALGKIFKKNKVKCEVASFEGAHQINPDAAGAEFLPFFEKNLVVK